MTTSTELNLNEDFVIYKDPETGLAMSGGYKIKSNLLKDQMRINIEDDDTSSDEDEDEDEKQMGGKKNIFDNLAIPVGVYYVPQPNKRDNTYKSEECLNKRSVLSDDLHDKLFALLEVTGRKKKKQTKKQPSKSSKKTTKKNKTT
jgi:hypothetical protein